MKRFRKLPGEDAIVWDCFEIGGGGRPRGVESDGVESDGPLVTWRGTDEVGPVGSGTQRRAGSDEPDLDFLKRKTDFKLIIHALTLHFCTSCVVEVNTTHI